MTGEKIFLCISLAITVLIFIGFVICCIYDSVDPCVIMHDVPDGGSYCNDSGKQIFNICPNCNFHPISYSEKFCSRCGSFLGG